MSKKPKKDRENILPDTGEEQEDKEDRIAKEQSDQQEQIIETGAVTPTKGKYVIHCLTVVGQIEGHYILPPQNKTTKYEHVIPQLVAIQENPEIQGLIIILNTVGGDVEAGLAIAELVSGMNKPTVSLVLGGGHSIGVPLAVSAKKSFIVPSATMTIHPVRMNGVVLGVPQTLSYFDKMQERIVGFVEENSNISPKKFRQLMMNTGELVMDVGTVLTGKQAVDAGLIDRLGGLSDAIECLYGMIEENLPDNDNDDDDDEKDAKARCGKRKRRNHDENTGGIENIGEVVAPALAAKKYRAGNSGVKIKRRSGHSATRTRPVKYAASGMSGAGTAARQSFTNGTATGNERQNAPPQIDYRIPNNKRSALHSMDHTVKSKSRPGEKGKGGKK